MRSEVVVYTHYVGPRFTCIYRLYKYYVVLQGCYKSNNSLYYGIQSSYLATTARLKATHVIRCSAERWYHHITTPQASLTSSMTRTAPPVVAAAY